MDSVDEDFVRERISKGVTHSAISQELQQLYPGVRGLSERSVRRFCEERQILRRCPLTTEELEDCVAVAVSEHPRFHS